MQPFPHRYFASSVGESSDSTTISSPGLDDIETHTTPEFDGPEGHWSPETMLVAAVANCFILTWRSVANHNKVEWHDMQVDAEGVLDRVDRVTRFTEIHLKVRVIVPAGTDHAQIEKLLEKAEGACLVSNSLNSKITMQTEVCDAD